MLFLQDPAPIFTIGTGPPIEAIIFITLAALTAATIIFLPLTRALGRRLSGADRAKMEELEQRVADLEMERLPSEDLQAIQGEVSDLHERVDFAERLLTQGPSGGGPEQDSSITDAPGISTPH